MILIGLMASSGPGWWEYLLTCGIGVEVWDVKLITLFINDEVINAC